MSDLVERIEFYLSCRGIPRLDLTSPSDPFCVVFLRNKDAANWTEFGKTEVIKDSADPQFVKQFVMDFHFEEVQELKVDVYDHDTHTNHDLVGSATFTGKLVGCCKCQTTKVCLF